METKLTLKLDRTVIDSAKECSIQTIITRNAKDYKEKGAVIQTPKEYVKMNRV